MKYVSILTRITLFAFILVLAPCIAGAAAPSDEALAKNVEHRLMTDTNFDATNVVVSSEEGVIHLRGEVKNRAAAKSMRDAAEKVPGVKGVETQFDFSTEHGR